MKFIRINGLLLSTMTLAGCATIDMGAHQPSMDTVVLLKNTCTVKMNVGEFALAPGVPATKDKSLGIRGNTLRSPNERSFAQYLKESLIMDLRSAGLFDADAPLAIQGLLTENKLNAAGSSQAGAALAATFRITRNAKTVYEKSLLEQQTWKSAFMGAVAIPDAINHYTDHYSKLLAQLYRDEEFKKLCSIG